MDSHNHRVQRFVFIVLVLIASACESPDGPIVLTGNTMGTTYRIKIADPSSTADGTQIQREIEDTLRDVNSRFSNWESSSEVTRFNSTPSTEPMVVSREFLDLLGTASDIHQASEGQFDVTLGPLIELWGFGTADGNAEPPTNAAVMDTMALVGQSRVLEIDTAQRTILKINPKVSLNFSSIAKGRGIDDVAATLEDFGFQNFLVEIGGDLYTKGENENGQPWRIGVERPGAAGKSVEKLVSLSGAGMATSGDYRNFFQNDGILYSHILDAKTGRPVTHTTASVTVVAENATLADAWATALLAHGHERGAQLADKFDIAALFIVRSPEPGRQQFIHFTTPSFDALGN
ncbi:MAG: FAD:protein FMN transferase [Pseudomonadota bacterium]